MSFYETFFDIERLSILDSHKLQCPAHLPPHDSYSPSRIGEATRNRKSSVSLQPRVTSSMAHKSMIRVLGGQLATEKYPIACKCWCQHVDSDPRVERSERACLIGVLVQSDPQDTGMFSLQYLTTHDGLGFTEHPEGMSISVVESVEASNWMGLQGTCGWRRGVAENDNWDSGSLTSSNFPSEFSEVRIFVSFFQRAFGQLLMPRRLHTDFSAVAEIPIALAAFA